MPYATSEDGFNLYYDAGGTGLPVIFVHEFAGDHRSWAPQVAALSSQYCCITYGARGYPPSDVPDSPAHYNQDRARDDIKSILDYLGIEKAHVVGLSMGGFATLHFGLAYPERALSLVVAGCGYGAEPAKREQFRAEAEATAQRIEEAGMAEFASGYAAGPARVQFQNKDREGWQLFADQLAEHSALGAACTMRGLQKERPSLWSLREAMEALTTPTLIVNGDEDEPCLEPGIMMRRAISTSGLVVLPKTGHTINLEESEAFNALLMDFWQKVEAGEWLPRDPRSVTDKIL